MITVNKERAEFVFGKLLDLYTSNSYPFNLPESKPPQTEENLPDTIEKGSLEHSSFLFTLCYWMRGGIKSHTATRLLSGIYEVYPELFYPESARFIDEKKFAITLKRFGLGFNCFQIAKIWKENFRRIIKLYDKDPRNIFKDISTYEEACDRILNRKSLGFKGFQEKMVSMLTYFYMDAGIIDPWHFPVPVDFHVMRIVFSNEILVADKSESNGNGFYTKPILSEVRKLFYDYCIEKNVSPLTLCDAVWLYSGLMCNKHPGNQSVVGKRNGRKTEVIPIKRWTRGQEKFYYKTCHVCSLNSTCRWCIPSAEYYIRGKINLREEREAPSQLILFE